MKEAMGVTEAGGIREADRSLAEYMLGNWAVIIVDEARLIRGTNERAQAFFADGCPDGQPLGEALPWIKEEWLNSFPQARIVKTSVEVKLLVDITAFPRSPGWMLLAIRNVDEYRNMDHLWCEVQDSLIGMQQFIDTSYDGIVIANGRGVVLSVNQAFTEISGLSEDVMIGKTVHELTESGLIPYSCTTQVLEQKKSVSAAVKYPQGKETVVSSTPLFDKHGNIVRVLSNIRDITRLTMLYEKLRSAKALAKQYQRELKNKSVLSDTLPFSLNRSRAMENIYDLANKVADTDLPLLMTGESGVGKTAMAKFIHTLSERNATGTFVHINCSAIPEALLESELFGYEAGSFTGAKNPKVGLFEMAHKGTILLDEIGDMPLVLQAKILNVLQERKFYRIGGTKEVGVDVRIIAATNTNLETLIANGSFRRDLFFRLNVVPIVIPPLRERKEEIPALISYYLQTSNERYNRQKTLSLEAVNILLEYDWPGNIRELQNLIERLVVVTNDAAIEPRHLPADLVDRCYAGLRGPAADERAAGAGPAGYWRPGMSLKSAVVRMEGQIIEQAVSFYGSFKEAAAKLEIDNSTLFRKLNRGNGQAGGNGRAQKSDILHFCQSKAGENAICERENSHRDGNCERMNKVRPSNVN